MSWRHCFGWIALALVLVPFFTLAFQIDFQRIEQLLRQHPLWAPLLFSLLMIAGILFSPIPTSPLTLMSANLFGFWGGLLVSLTSATLGAGAAFLIARALGQKFLTRYPAFRKFQNLLPQDVTALAIFLLRIPPSPTFDAVSYLAGLTRIGLGPFLLATFFGMVPVTATLCLAGTVIPSIWLWPLLLALALFAAYRFWPNHSNRPKLPL